MITVSDEQVAQAAREAEQAESDRAAAEEALKGSPFSETAARKLPAASLRAAQLAAEAREVRAKQARQVAELKASRQELERAAAKEIRQADREVEAERKKLVVAAAEAQAAIEKLMVQAVAYSSVVDRHAEVLAGQGLDLGGDNGGGRGMSGLVLRVGGRRCESVDSGAVALWVVRRVATARLPHLHNVRGLMEGMARGFRARFDQLLAGVPEPQVVEHPRVPRLLRADEVARASK